ncbi:MAG: type VI secretion system baseplate subunit TssF [Gammaproteobacteria bacterium]
MDPRLLQYYNRELQFIREMGSEFAQAYPKIAGRLGMESLECADPYVERLLEGFAFLTARVQLKIDAEFPRFTQHMLETVYPHYLAPLPSAVVVQLQAELSDGGLATGIRVPRQSVLRSRTGKGELTACEFRTAHEVTLLPLEVREAQYLAGGGNLAAIGVTDLRGAKSGLRLRLAATAGLNIADIALEHLTLYLHGGKQVPYKILEYCIANTIHVVARPAGGGQWQESIARQQVQMVGLGDEETLLPQTAMSFSGYRLLQEYFLLPARFLFVDIGGLKQAAARCEGTDLEIVVLFGNADPELERLIDPSLFLLHCTPALNLFAKSADRIHVNERDTEFHVVPDRTRPMDYEVHSVTGVTGYGTHVEQEFKPFYAADDYTQSTGELSYYTVHRAPRVLSDKQRLQGPRSSYVGHELYLSLVDAREAPYSAAIRQLAVETLCTNRDLPLTMPIGATASDFSLEAGVPVPGVRCLAGPTRPRPPYPDGDTCWRIINHLSLNYLSLVDSDGRQGASALRDLLALYGDGSDPIVRKQIEGVRSITSRPINRRLPSPGPITFGRGLEITVTMEEAAFEGTGVFLLGAILEQFFARYVSINSFTETVLHSQDRGEIMRWPTRLGRRQAL